MTAEEFFTPKEYAREVGVCLRTVRDWIKRQSIPGLMRVGGRWRIPKHEVQKSANLTIGDMKRASSRVNIQ